MCFASIDYGSHLHDEHADKFMLWYNSKVLPAIKSNSDETGCAPIEAAPCEESNAVQEIKPPEAPTVSEMSANNQLTVFDNPEFGSVRTIEENGKVLFCGSDVAKALGYANPRDAINRHCRGVVKRDGVSQTTNQHGKTTNQITSMSFIPEGDVYRLIVHSKLPSAEKFERWVFDEVLPAIRKTGGYIAGEEHMTDEELVGKALLIVNAKLNFYKVEKDTGARSVSCVMWLYTKQYGLQQK